jgi:hypothetical protein
VQNPTNYGISKECAVSYLSQIERLQKRQVRASNALEETVEKMMNDRGFMGAIDDMIEAARAGVQFALLNKKNDMQKFNVLCLEFFDAMKRSDLLAATSAAQALVRSGHGEMFGLK